jgi:hypothetical protein
LIGRLWPGRHLLGPFSSLIVPNRTSNQIKSLTRA